MKKSAAIGIVSIFLTFILAGSALAAAPDLEGTWNGTARKVTDSGCTTEAIRLTLTQCGNLFRGTLTVTPASSTTSTSINVVGRWTTDNSLSFHGTQGTVVVRSTLLFGKFAPATSTHRRRIIASEFSFTSSSSNANVEYDGFSLSQPTSPF
ncbi:MAG: hypothetical protein AB9866_10795 [Syntrophobacteraceae bacterium]